MYPRPHKQSPPLSERAGRTLRYFQFHTAVIGNIFVITRRHSIDCNMKAFLPSVECLADGVFFAKLHKLDDEFAELYSHSMTVGCIGREMKDIADNSMGEHMNIFEVHNVVPLKGRGLSPPRGRTLERTIRSDRVEYEEQSTCPHYHCAYFAHHCTNIFDIHYSSS